MPLDFPNSPSVNQQYTVGSTTWIWDGTVWNAQNAALDFTGYVETFNGATGDVEGVSSFNGATGDIVGVNSVNGLTGSFNLKPDISVTPLSNGHISATHNLATAAQTAVLMSANTAHALPLVLGYDVDVDAANIHVTTSAVGADLQLALYESGSNGFPTSTPIYTSGTLSGASTGVKTEAFTAFTLEAGKQYWLAVNSGSTGCTVRAVSSGTQRVLKCVGNASNQEGLLRWSQSGFSWRDFSSTPTTTSDITVAHGPMLYFTAV